MKLKLFTTILLLLTIAWVVDTQMANTSTAGAPSGFTGSPFDNKTCGTNGGCHGGGVTQQTGWITSDVPVSGYVPGNTYSITATVTEAAITKFGFQVSPQDIAGNLVGSLIASVETQVVGSKYMTHLSTSTSGSGSRAWQFNWVAPVGGTGDVTFYGAFNATNANGATSGDNVHSSTLTVEEDTTVNVAEQLAVSNNPVKLYPNPVGDVATFSLRKDETDVSIRLFTASGQLVHSMNGLSGNLLQAEVGHLSAGQYLYEVNTPETRLSTGWLIKK